MYRPIDNLTDPITQYSVARRPAFARSISSTDPVAHIQTACRER